MDAHGLGPNGAILYCMEYLEANLDWLETMLNELGPDAYVLFDMPGQVELGTIHASLKRIIQYPRSDSGYVIMFRLCGQGFTRDAMRG